LLTIAALCISFALISPYIENGYIFAVVAVAIYTGAYSVVPITVKILGEKSMGKYYLTTAILGACTIGAGTTAACVVSTPPGTTAMAACIAAGVAYAVSGIVIGGSYIQGGTRAMMKVILAAWITGVIKDMGEKGFLPGRFVEKAESLGLPGVRSPAPLDERLKNRGKPIRQVAAVPPAKKDDGDDKSSSSTEDEPATITIPIPIPTAMSTPVHSYMGPLPPSALPS